MQILFLRHMRTTVNVVTNKLAKTIDFSTLDRSDTLLCRVENQIVKILFHIRSLIPTHIDNLDSRALYGMSDVSKECSRHSPFFYLGPAAIFATMIFCNIRGYPVSGSGKYLSFFVSEWPNFFGGTKMPIPFQLSN